MKDFNGGPVDPIYVSPNWELVDRKFYVECVWRPARQLHERLGGRTAWLTALKMLQAYEDRLYFPEGQRYLLSSIDTTFGDARWIGMFLEADASGEAPRVYTRQYDRLRVIELYCRLKSDGPNWGKFPRASGDR